MLNLNNITKRYGEKVIFKNMNIQFDNTNEINGIIGKVEVVNLHCLIFFLV